MVKGVARTSDQTLLDVLYVTELRFPGGSSSSLVEEALAASASGYRVGVLQCDSSSLRADRSFHPGIRELVDNGKLLLVRPGEPVSCSVAIVKHPTVLVAPLGGRLPVQSKNVVVFAGQVPEDPDGTRYYTPSDVHQNVVDAFGSAPVWHPVSPTVRRSLLGSGVPLSPKDWVEVIDVDQWASDSPRPVGDLPVIGRHGRTTALKWPANSSELLAAYPDSDEVLVSVLGGVDGLDAVLPRVPDSWEVHPFGSMDAREFLAGIDFFVYYHHPDLVEAFGRTVIEALASGCVTILPESFRELFGDACLYTTPAGVSDLVTGLHADPEAFRRQAQLGTDIARERFSYATHLARVEALAGPPSLESDFTQRAAPRAKVPKGLRSQRPVVMFVCIGADPSIVAATIRNIDQHRDRAMGFHPVVVATATAPEISQALDEDLLLDQDKRYFVSEKTAVVLEVVPERSRHLGPGRWEDETLSRLANISRRHRVTSVTVPDLDHEDAWLGLQASP